MFRKLVDERATDALKCRYLCNYNVYIIKICEKLTLIHRHSNIRRRGTLYAPTVCS